MNSLKVILATLVIFGAGLLTGGLVVAYSSNIRHQRLLLADGQRLAPKTNSVAMSNPTPRAVRVPLPSNILLRKDFLERLDKELKLQPEQREKIEKIVSEGQERIKVCCQKIEPELRGELAETRENIMTELLPPQQELFSEMLKRRFAPARGTNSPSSQAVSNRVQNPLSK